ncbi:MAG: hypothetical protein JW953_10340, partial [Anaerolineae bacterium]|nr:hypothetical protein [Anaerolineae bacterium]
QYVGANPCGRPGQAQDLPLHHGNSGRTKLEIVLANFYFLLSTFFITAPNLAEQTAAPLAPNF